jgi:hypothetical protein
MLKKSNTSNIKPNISAQISIEFTFSMVITLIMIYSIIRIFTWTGTSVGDTQKTHESMLAATIDESYSTCIAYDEQCGSHCIDVCTAVDPNPTDGPAVQLAPFFTYPSSMNALWSD